MSIDAATFARLREIADELSQLPMKPRVEIGPQGLVMMMSATTPHGLTAIYLRRQLEQQAPDALVFTDTDMQDVELGRMRVPDLMVLPMDVIDSQPQDAVNPAMSSWSSRSSPGPIRRTTTATRSRTTRRWASRSTSSLIPAAARPR